MTEIINNQEFELGSTLEDMVTGRRGICIGRLEYLNGCVQYGIKSKVGKDGKSTSEWVDSQQIKFIDKGISKTIQRMASTGGYSADAPAI